MSKILIKNGVKNGLYSALEMGLIREYLLEKGFSLEDLEIMSATDSRNLMTEACVFASLQLAEMESRARFRQNLLEISQSLA